MFEDSFDNYWENSDQKIMSKKFDDLWEFLPKADSILDIGGGNGALKDSLDRVRSDNNTAYTVVDFSKQALEKVVKNGGIGICQSLDKSLSIKDNSYELVILSDVLEHVTNPWALLKEAKRVSSKYVFVRGPNFASLGCRWDLLRGRPIRQMSASSDGSLFLGKSNKVSHIYFITYKNLILWGNRVGLKVNKKRVFWYKRYAPLRLILEAFFSNWGERYDVLFVKSETNYCQEDFNLRFIN